MLGLKLIHINKRSPMDMYIIGLIYLSGLCKYAWSNLNGVGKIDL